VSTRTQPGSVLMDLPGLTADHRTTLAQIGRWTLTRLGARDIVYSDEGGYVMFRVGSGRPYRKIIVMLRPSDTYGVEVGHLKKHDGLPEFFSDTVVDDHVFAEDLAETVERLYLEATDR
jgi:hypothetical protein